MKILVTGSSGYIGSSIVKYLVDNQISVLGVDIKDSIIDHPLYQHLKHDLIDPLPDLDFEPQVCIHLTASVQVNESQYNPQKYYLNNLIVTFNMLNFLKEIKCRNIIFSSTAAVYGNPPMNGKAHQESEAGDFPSVYGKTKWVCEELIADYVSAYQFRAIVFRFFNVAGKPETEAIHLIPILLKALSENKKFTIYGSDYNTRDGTCLRDYIHMMDLVDAHWKAIQLLADTQYQGFEVINLGTSNGYTVKEIVSKCLTFFDPEAASLIQIGDRRSGDPAILVADNTKANQILNWTPKYQLSDIIQDAI